MAYSPLWQSSSPRQLFSPSRGGDIVNNKLPTNLGRDVRGEWHDQWNLYFASPAQLNVLAGPCRIRHVPVTVVTNCGTANEVSSTAVNVTVAAVRPSFSPSSQRGWR